MKKIYNNPSVETVEICLATGICSLPGYGGEDLGGNPGGSGTDQSL